VGALESADLLIELGEGRLVLRSFRSQKNRDEVHVLKQDARISEHSEPIVEALSRWENDGGAPDRRSEFDNCTVRNASSGIAVS